MAGTGNEPQEPDGAPRGRFELPPDHWSLTRGDRNREALEHYRTRSRAPGVEAGGSHRNHYCMECHGVVPLEYDQRRPADPGVPPEHCPHCGAELDLRVREMFNWVEIDQPPPSDRGLKLLAAGVVLALAAVAVGLLLLL